MNVFIKDLIHKTLIQFPLWSLLLGVLSGVYLADASAETWHIALWILFFIFVFTIGGLLIVKDKSLHFILILLGVSLGFFTHLRILHRQSDALEIVKNYKGVSSLNAVVIDSSLHENGTYLVRVKQSNILPSGVHLVLKAKGENLEQFHYGDVVEASGFVKPITAPRNPYKFNFQQWRHRQGADIFFFCRKISKKSPSLLYQPLHIISQWKLPIREKITAGLDSNSEAAQVIRAVTLGEKPPRASPVTDQFKESGALHLFAVSGLHVGMVGGIIAWLVLFFRAPYWLSIILTIVGMVIYAAITGLNPPAVRAVIMCSFFLASFLIKRKSTLINSFAASAIIVLLLDGHQLFTVSFQLSYGVLLAISLFCGFLYKQFAFISFIDPFMPRSLLCRRQVLFLKIRTYFQQCLSLSTSACMAASPLMWVYFGIVTPISIIASIPLAFFVFLMLILSFCSLIFGSLYVPIGHNINQVNAALAGVTSLVAREFAKVPYGHFSHRLGLPQDDQIIVFDLPKGGGANFINIGDGVLLDSGRTDHFLSDVKPALDYLQVEPQSLIISHADVKHCAAMSECSKIYHSKQAIIPLTSQRSLAFKRFLETANKENTRLIIPAMGQIFTLEQGNKDVYLEILHAPAELDGRGVADDTGLVLRLYWHGWRILFMGDAGMVTESRLLENGTDIQADVIIMGRNSYDFTGHEAFIRSVSPKVIISSNSDFLPGQKISQSWKDMLKRFDIKLLDQKLTGGVIITLKKNELLFSPTLQEMKTIRLAR